MRIRLVAADLDETLMDRSLCFSPRVRAVSQKLSRQGTLFTIVTGRIFAETLPYARQLAIPAPLICSQGGHIRSLDSPHPLHEVTLSRDLAEEVIQLSREARWQVSWVL